MPPFSTRSRVHAEINPYSAALSAARAEGGLLLDLSSGNPCELGLGFDSAALAALLSDPDIARYAPTPFGLMRAREALSRELLRTGCAVPPEQILLTASTSEAYGYLFKLLCDPGDSVLVPEPSYPLLSVLAQLEGVTLVPYSLRYDGEWHIDPASLAAAQEAAGARARAVVTVHPNNPTGSYLKRDELELLVRTGLPILSDEVFSEYALGPDPRRAETALAAADRALVFRLSGLSKSLLLPQLKLAYTAFAGPADTLAETSERLAHIADAYLSPATPVQLALPRLLDARDRVQAPALARVRANYAELTQRLRGSAATALRVEGGFYGVVRLPAVCSDEDFCLALLAKDGVVAQPGYFFDLPDAHLVVSLITPCEIFQAGCARLRARVDCA